MLRLPVSEVGIIMPHRVAVKVTWAAAPMMEHTAQHEFLWGAQQTKKQTRNSCIKYSWQIKQTAKSGWRRRTGTYRPIKDHQTLRATEQVECSRTSPKLFALAISKMHRKYQTLTTNGDFEDETLYVTGAFTLVFKFVSHT